MRIARTMTVMLVCSLLMVLLLFCFVTPQLHAESYVAGQLGMTFPQSLSSGEVTQDGFGGLSISDQPLKSSLFLGAKLGHFFSRARWMGIETGLSYSNPHIKEGSLTFSGPGGSATSGTLAGVSQRVIIWDVATLIFRYPRYRLQPYVGIGPALFFATLKGPAAPPGQSATAIGLNAEAGLRYYLTRHWTIFGEGKYNCARMDYSSNHSDPAADPFAFRATYSALTLSIGFSYNF